MKKMLVAVIGILLIGSIGSLVLVFGNQDKDSTMNLEGPSQLSLGEDQNDTFQLKYRNESLTDEAQPYRIEIKYQESEPRVSVSRLGDSAFTEEAVPGDSTGRLDVERTSDAGTDEKVIFELYRVSEDLSGAEPIDTHIVTVTMNAVDN